MANPIALPSDIILAITTIKATSIDPNDFNNAIQELYNRGYGIQGKWIQDHKELFMQALQDGYISEADLPQVPKSETKRAVPPVHKASANDPEDGGINPEPPIDTSGFSDDPTGEAVPDGGIETAEEPAEKPHKHK